MSDGYFDIDYGAQEDFNECYNDQLYDEEAENAYGQSQDHNEGEMDNYLAVQDGEQAAINAIEHLKNTATSSSHNYAISYSADETEVFQRDGSPSEGVIRRRGQQQ
ncbi:hypothetical protein BGZ91_004260 [Linnemannia elongata]|nr:hypothetical protein BGZ91_004260 [Linnemannia elongata]KAG0053054.1 hypothetical protein BGZ90_006317 [Linnemannia elongata]